LRCAHCAIATVAPAERSKVSLPLDQAERIADELPDLARQGVTRISFTGGEPLLALRQLRLLADAAATAGIATTVVTACHWASNELAARRMIGDTLAAIDVWHLSTDVFHREFISIDHIRRAAVAAAELGRPTTIRVAVHSPPDNEDRELVNELYSIIPDGVSVTLQPVVGVGRAQELALNRPRWSGHSIPCVSTGPLIRDDGSVSPCCASLTDEREGHPFIYPNAFDHSLVDVRDAWLRDPLVRLIRSVGFAPVLAWVAEDLPDHPAFADLPEHPCDICVALWQRSGTAAAVRARVERPAVRDRIDELHDAVFRSIQSLPEEAFT
jgi:pyruvate-formate lyase-activating enzyme